MTTATVFEANDRGARARYCLVDGCNRPSSRVIYPRQLFTCADHVIYALPSLAQGQTGDLVYDDQGVRIWRERITTADGAPYDRTAVVEMDATGRWETWAMLDVDDPETSRVFARIEVMDALRAVGLLHDDPR